MGIGIHVQAFIWNSHFQVDPYLKEPKNRHLFEQLEDLVETRDNTILKIRQSEAEVRICYS